MADERQPESPYARQIHDPHQITEVSQLKVGERYQRMSKIGGKARPEGIITLLGLSKDGKSIVAEEVNGHYVHLQDCGVIPYTNASDGIERWHPDNYLVPVD